MSDCINYPGRLTIRGYGRYSLDGRMEFAHRVAYCVRHRVSLDSIKGLVVMHACDNPACVNADHLLLGTIRDNNLDKTRKLRSKFPQPKLRKLTTEDVLEIRSKHTPNDPVYGTAPMARRFDILTTSLYKILNNKTYRDLPGRAAIAQQGKEGA